MKNYGGEPFQFKIGDSAYVLQELGMEDLRKATAIGDLISTDVQKGVDAIRELIEAKSDKRTADAVMTKMPPRKVLELIKDWTGMQPGESLSSGDESDDEPQS